MSKIHVIDLHFLGNTETIAAFLIETSTGPILVETGPHSTLPQLEAGIAQAGYTSQDIKKVFLTHIHLDHAGAAWYFAQLGATIHVHPKGYKHLLSPEKLLNSARMIYQDQMDRLWGEMQPIPADRLVQVEDRQSFDLGDSVLEAHYTPGHAVHHIAWQLGDQLFCGDVAGVKISDGPVVPPCPPPDIHVEDWQNSIQRILQLPLNRLYLTHYGAIDNIQQHLGDLEKVLLDWANWMKPHYDQKNDPKVVTPMFQQYVQENLVAAEVNEMGLQQYESANPAWMSVAGLMRYWKIRERNAAS